MKLTEDEGGSSSKDSGTLGCTAAGVGGARDVVGGHSSVGTTWKGCNQVPGAEKTEDRKK